MDKLRLLFSKTGRAVYISHLDLMRTLTRAFKRADCNLKYSEGFNPHPNISIAMPLSVGAESVCEILDFKLLDDMEPEEILKRLKTQLPEGISALEVYQSDRKVRELKWLKIEGVFEYDERSSEEMLPKLCEFFAKDSIVIQKKTKRGIGESDIKPAIKDIAFSACDNIVCMNATISAQEPTLNPELLADALRQLMPEIAPDFAKFKRLEIFDENMSVFR
ncbi:MAG: TIGR03936 family radical SAM-associated protein [Bacillota bacterium]|nr:TIGR03936 family radical SAM-associated protein [Bacillota bacterium]